MTAREKLIVALDFNDREQIIGLVKKLHGRVGMFKIGLEPFCLFGPPLVATVKELGERVFLDLKFHDIPRTVAQGVRAAARMGVDLCNIHIAGGSRMMEAAVAAVAAEGGRTQTKVIGVTLLTSLGESELRREIGVPKTPLEQVLHWARLAQRCGLAGVVASPMEAGEIRQACGQDYLIVTPGIRPAGKVEDDQKRISTPVAALRAGADYLVVGRPITLASDPVQATEEIVAEMEEM